MTDQNPYLPPKSSVRETADAEEKPTASTRFALTTAIAFPVYVILWLFINRFLSPGIIMSNLAVAVLAGVVALCIPVRSKWLFVVLAIVIAFVLVSLAVSYKNCPPVNSPRGCAT